MDPAPYVDNWHIEVICEHLEAISRRQIRKLLINMPPRHMKSILLAVMWPAWTWLHNPSRSQLFASYAHSLSIRDSVKCRRLLLSPVYHQLKEWCESRWEFASDQNAKERFENTAGGYRLATSVEGALTGEGADDIVVDDAHNVVEGESEVEREKVLTWWDESMSTRLNDPQTGAYVVNGQRVHENDISGHIQESLEEQGWTFLCLPARYEGSSRSRSHLMPILDRRSRIGEPLWPQRFGEAELKDLETRMTPYSAACQLQQRPQPREGGMFKPDKLLKVRAMPPAQNIIKGTRYWDKAATEGGGCNSAGVLVYKVQNEPYSYLIADGVVGHWSASHRNQIMKSTADLDGRSIRIVHEQEPGSGGKESAEATNKLLDGFLVEADKVTGSKVTRAEPFSCQVNAGNVAILLPPVGSPLPSWIRQLLNELEMFPTSKTKDLVDATSGAYNSLALKQEVKAGVWGSRA